MTVCEGVAVGRRHRLGWIWVWCGEGRALVGRVRSKVRLARRCGMGRVVGRLAFGVDWDHGGYQWVGVVGLG